MSKKIYIGGDFVDPPQELPYFEVSDDEFQKLMELGLFQDQQPGGPYVDFIGPPTFDQWVEQMMSREMLRESQVIWTGI